MTIGDLKKAIAPLADDLEVMRWCHGERVPVQEAGIYREPELAPDEKSWVTVETLDIS